MGLLTEELKIELEKLVEYLEAQDEAHWVKWMNEARREINNSDFHGIEKILSAYGGMGSINDITDSKGLVRRVYKLADTIKNAQ